MAIRMRKTIIVGLGGTGIGAVLNMKREFQDHFSEVPPIVQIVCFDTDTIDLEMRDSVGQPVELVGNEFVYLKLSDPQAVLDTFEEVRSEFPMGKVRLRALLTGAGQVRARGRLALLANAGLVHRNLKHAHEMVTAAESADWIRESSQFDLSTDPCVTVYIVSSLAGGTGAGVFLDIAYQCREILDRNDRVIGVFLLPPIFASLPATDYINGNAYACLKELDYLMDRDLNVNDIVDYGRDLKVNWGQHYPFDQVYLIDNKNEKGTRINALDQVIRFIGRAIFANTNVVAEREDDVLDNLAGQNVALEPWGGNKMPYYASFGASALELPIRKIVDLSVYEKIGKIISGGLLSSSKEDVEEDVTNFTQRIKIAEIGADDVIDTIIPPRPLSPSHLAEAWRLPNPETAIADWKTRENQMLRDKYGTIAKENYKTKLEDAKRAVSEKIESGVALKGGVDYSRFFVKSLLTRVAEDRRMMESEKAEFEGQAGAVQNEYPSSEQIQDACGGLFNKPRIERTVNKIEQAMNHESQLMLEVIRRDYAIDFFAELIELVKRYEERVDTVVSTLEAASAEVSRRMKTLLGLKEVNTFTKHLDASYLKEEIESLGKEVTIEYVLQTLRQEGESPLLWADPEWDGSRVVERIKGIVFARYRALEESGIEHILAKLADKDKKKLNNILKDYLVDRATPLWKYNESVAGRRNLAEIFIFGVQDEGDSIFQKLDTKQFGVSTQRYELASTGNKYTISAFKYKLRVPAYIIEGMEEYKRDYLRNESREDFTHHIRRAWADNPDRLGDLFPERMKGTEEQKMYWAVAFAEPFKLIWDVPGWHYYIRSEKVGKKVDDYKVLLAQGRRKAFDEFTGGEHSREFFDEVKEKVDAIVQEKGNAAIAESLRAYVQGVVEMLDRQSGVKPEVKDLLEDECEAIDRFTNKITTIH